MFHLEYLDTADVAKLTGISCSTLEKWRLQGNMIPFIRAGRCIKYSINDVRAWMDSHRVTSTSQDPANTCAPGHSDE